MPNKLSVDHPAMQDRACMTCGEFKLASDFSTHKHPHAKEGFAAIPHCKECMKLIKFKRHLLNSYNLDWAEYLRMVDEQKGRCFLCGSRGSGKDKKLCVDHNHTTGKIRGLLCWNCNVGIGLFKEDPDLLRKVIDYIGKE